MPLKPGTYDGISLIDYHNDPAVSRSDLMLLRENPMKFKVQRGLIKSRNEIFDIGTAAHAAVLEPNRYWDQVAVIPTSVLGKSGARNTKAYKKWANDPARVNKAIITQDQSAIIKGIIESVYENPAHTTARAIFTSPYRIIEQSILFYDATYGFLCKIRPDIQLRHIGILVDLKTSKNASYSSFQRDVANYHYDAQAAFYLTGARIGTEIDFQDFLFVVVEKEPPYCVAIYRADQEMLDNGRRKIRPLIQLYNECLESGIWPGYYDGIVDLNLPRWAIR